MAIESSESVKLKVIKQLADALSGDISNSKIVLRSTIWILGEYSNS